MAELARSISSDSVLGQKLDGQMLGGDPKKAALKKKKKADSTDMLRKREGTGGTRAQRARRRSSTVPVMSPVRSASDVQSQYKTV